jgi:phosphoribosylformylglycinamidine synthase
VVGVLGALLPGLGGSVYAELAGHEPDDRAPAIDLDAHKALLGLLVDAAAAGLLRSAQDISGGGLAVALAECCIWGDLGADLRLGWGGPPATALFGEGPSRVVVSTTPGDWQSLVALARRHGVPIERLGETGGDRLRMRLAGDGAVGLLEERGSAQVDLLDAPVALLREAWLAGLPRALGDDEWQATPGMTGPASTTAQGAA